MRRHRRPVVELSVTYETAMGVIEVVSADGNKRDELARLFADTVLGHSIAGHRIRLREYDLSRLLAPFDFPFDAEDGIKSVKLVLLRVQRPGGRHSGSIHLSGGDHEHHCRQTDPHPPPGLCRG